jgi:hypothetical protein
MIFRDLFLRIRALGRPRRAERKLHDELAFHIERETLKHIADGLSPTDARARALERFGSVPLAADQCRDVRGTAVVDALTRDIVYAFRTFRRAACRPYHRRDCGARPWAHRRRIRGLRHLFLRVDAVRNPGELFAVERLADSSADAPLPFTQPEYQALRRETSVFTDTFAMLIGGARIEGRRVTSSLVTGNFFQVLGVQAALGRPLMTGDEEQFARLPGDRAQSYGVAEALRRRSKRDWASSARQRLAL